MIIGVTERGTFKRCRRQWYLTSMNQQGLEKIIPRPALQLGSLYHRAHADWIHSPDIESLAGRFKHYSIEELDRVRTNYRQIVGASPSDEEMEPSYTAMRVGLAMCQNYEQRWQTPLPHGFTLALPEQRILAPIPGTPHFLEGTLDGIIYDDKGYLYVLERKTYEQRPNAQTMEHSDQFLAYIWLLNQLKVGEVAGVAYDGAWKREVPPKGKVLEDLFLRVILRRPREEVQEFEQLLQIEATEMAQNPPETINRRWEGCHDCGVEPICSAMSKGQDYKWIIQTDYTTRKREDWLPPKSVEQVRTEFEATAVPV